MEIDGVATREQFDDDTERAAGEIRQKIISEIRKKAGTNDQVRYIEDEKLKYEDVLDMYKTSISYAQHLRQKRKNAVEKGIKEHRMPIIPRFRLKKGKKL